MKKILYDLLILIIIAGCWECKKDISPDKMPFTIQLKEDSTIFLLVNDTFKIKVSPFDAKVNFTVNVDYAYKDPKIAVISISPEGIIKALEPGKVFVSVNNNAGNKKFNLIVFELPEKIQLKDSSLIIKTGRNVQLDFIQVYDQYQLLFFGGFKWEISDITVASVSDKGNIVAIKEGQTKLRVSLRNFPNVYSEYTVQVLDYIVYVLGQCQNDNNLVRSCYWKNNLAERSDLYKIAYDPYQILISNNNIYIVGTSSSNPDKAFIMKNNTVTLFKESEARATGVATVGDDVYAGGSYTYSGIRTVALWKNNTLSPLIDNDKITLVSIGTAIAVSGGNTFISGYIKNIQNKQVACYWKNNERIDLSDGKSDAIANSIFVVGTDVYTVGHTIDTNTGYSVACYWKNGIKTNLIPDNLIFNNSDAISIFVSNGAVFVCGYYFNSTIMTSCYWENVEKIDLSVGINAIGSCSSSIKVADGNVFISGYYFLKTFDNPIGCYWKNGVRFDIPPTTFKDGDFVYTYKYSTAWNLAID